ncbi:MAG: type II toxin-antitoxin system RelE/ParE family toxin [Oscillospiraceae bacterium]|jgi:plasmid stabilization system protein ParE|nr:type II toxin-antitoxin system RelE/ParE family toxin [Oscillospiraceae bacterium]
MEPKTLSVFVDPQADRKLAHHIEFLARVSEAAATRLYQAYEDALHFIMDFPEACPAYLPQKPTDARLRYSPFGKRYRIVFEVVGGEVYVYDIQDCRQDSDKNLV